MRRNKHFATKSTTIVDKKGRKLFTLRKTSQGAPCIVLNKEARINLDVDDFVNHIKVYFEKLFAEVSEHSDTNKNKHLKTVSECSDSNEEMTNGNITNKK